MLGDFGLLNWIIIICYMAANLGLGWYMSRRVKSSKDFYLGDRSAPWWAIGISVMATYISALSFLGGPAWAYGDGMAALAIHINYSLVVFICIVLFIPFFYNSGVTSIYEYLEHRFGMATRTVMGVLFVVSMVLGAASILAATAIVINFITDMSIVYAIVSMTLIVILYTMMGGMNSVIWTDVLQGVILIFGVIVVLWILLAQLGPMSDTLEFLAQREKLAAINWDFDLSIAPTIWAGVFAMTLYHVTVYGANQFMVQRALAAKSIGDAKKSYLIMGFGAFFLYFIFFLVGALLFVHYQGKQFEQTNSIILIFVESIGLPGLMGIIAAAILSASMSSTSSALNSLSTVSVLDFYKQYVNKNGSDQHYLKCSRYFTALWGIAIIPIAIVFAQSTGSILELLSRVASYFVGAKLAIFAMGFFSKHVTERGLLVGVFAGFFGLFLFAPLNIMVPAVDSLWSLMGLQRPSVAWPWYVVISGSLNIAIAWLYSVMTNGFASSWHPQSVKGQIDSFIKEGKSMKADGWYLVPGKIDRVVWLLPLFFVGTMVFLHWFGGLA